MKGTIRVGKTGRETEEKRERERPFICWLAPQMAAGTGHGETEADCQEIHLGSDVGAGSHVVASPSAAFPGTLAGNSEQKWSIQDSTSAHMKCWHHGLNLPQHWSPA